MGRVILHVPGRPTGKQRPRFNRQTGRAYTPTQTKAWEQRVQGEWIAAGRPRLPDGPLEAWIVAVYQRPGSHLRVKGGLTAAGKRTPFPMPRVDVDNLCKAALDSLNGLAYRDDALVVAAHVWRRWAAEGEHEHLEITVESIPVEFEAAA